MSGSMPIGLVSTGSGGQPFVVRLPALLERLGPVKGASFSAARKLVRSLRAGYAISDYAALDGCESVWVIVPEAHLDDTLAHLVMQSWVRRTPVILCQTPRESRSVGVLLSRGAKVATVNAVDESRRGLVVAEGQPAALRTVRRICSAGQRPLIQIGNGGKPQYFAGIHLATDLLRPWVILSMDCLRLAGFTRAQAAELVLGLSTRSLRMHVKAGNPRIGAPQRAQLRRALEDAERMRVAGSPEAAMYAAGIHYALGEAGGTRRARAGA